MIVIAFLSCVPLSKHSFASVYNFSPSKFFPSATTGEIVDKKCSSKSLYYTQAVKTLGCPILPTRNILTSNLQLNIFTMRFFKVFLVTRSCFIAGRPEAFNMESLRSSRNAFFRAFLRKNLDLFEIQVGVFQFIFWKT